MTTTEMLDELKYLYQQEQHAIQNVTAIQGRIDEIRQQLINSIPKL